VETRAAVTMLHAMVALDEANVEEAKAAFEVSEELSREAGVRPHPVYSIVGPTLYLYGYGDEARARDSIAAILADDDADAWTQAGVLMSLGMIDAVQGLDREGEVSLRVAADRIRALGDRFGLALVLTQAAHLAEDRGDYAGAESALLDALDQIDQLDAREDAAWLRIRLGWVRGLAGDETGQRQIEDGLDRARDIGATETVAMGLYYEATLARYQGDLAGARRGYEESLAVMEAMQAMPPYLAFPLVGLGFVAEQEGDAERAEASHRRALRMLLDGQTVSTYYRLLLADAVEGLAGAAALAGRAERAATLLGAAAALRDRFRAWATQRLDRDRASAAARRQLGAEDFEGAWRRGEAMTVEEILAVIA
jgi:hypothetical protein